MKLDSSIELSFLVCPDSTYVKPKERRYKMNASKNIRSGKRYSPLTNILYYNELISLIKSKSQSILEEINLKDSVRVVTPSKYAKNGFNLEKTIAKVLNNKEIKKLWNTKSTIIKELNQEYSWFFNIMITFGIDPESEQIQEINATTEIPKLPSGGSPKTDVAATVQTNKDTYKINISCKNTTRKVVTVHQYKVEEYVKVLGIQDSQIINSLELFQQVGGIQKFKKNYPENFTILNSAMPAYKEFLIKWVYFGIGGEGINHQIANMIITYNPEIKNISIYNKTDFIRKQMKFKRQFGTPFQWTYASGSLGKSIQLKGSTQ